LSEKPNQGVLVEFAGFSEDQRRAIRSVLEDKFTLQERENEGRQGLEILDPTITVEDIRSALDAHLSFSIVTENVQAPANRMSPLAPEGVESLPFSHAVGQKSGINIASSVADIYEILDKKRRVVEKFILLPEHSMQAVE